MVHIIHIPNLGHAVGSVGRSSMRAAAKRAAASCGSPLERKTGSSAVLSFAGSNGNFHHFLVDDSMMIQWWRSLFWRCNLDECWWMLMKCCLSKAEKNRPNPKPCKKGRLLQLQRDLFDWCRFMADVEDWSCSHFAARKGSLRSSRRWWAIDGKSLRYFILRCWVEKFLEENFILFLSPFRISRSIRFYMILPYFAMKILVVSLVPFQDFTLLVDHAVQNQELGIARTSRLRLGESHNTTTMVTWCNMM